MLLKGKFLRLNNHVILHLLAYQDQFAKYSHGVIDKMNKDYDIRSLMHYSATAFGDNGKTTIVSLDPSKPVGAAVTYTELDIIEINALYNCKTSSNCKCVCVVSYHLRFTILRWMKGPDITHNLITGRGYNRDVARTFKKREGICRN